MREVTLPEAANALGLTREGVRRRLLKERLEGHKSQETGEWLVMLSDEQAARLAPPTVADGAQPSPTVGSGGPELVAERQRLEVEAARLEERLAAAERLLAEREGTIADLRRERERADRLERELAEARRPLLLRLVDALRR